MCANRENRNHNIFDLSFREMNRVQSMLYRTFPNLTRASFRFNGRRFDNIVIDQYVNEIDDLVEFYSEPEHYNNLIDDIFNIEHDLHDGSYREWNLDFRIRYVTIRLLMVWNPEVFIPPYDLMDGVNADTYQFYNPEYDIDSDYNRFLFEMFMFKLENTIYGDGRDVNFDDERTKRYYNFIFVYNNQRHKIYMGFPYGLDGRIITANIMREKIQEIRRLMSGEERRNIKQQQSMTKTVSDPMLDVNEDEPVLPLITFIQLSNHLPKPRNVSESSSVDSSEDFSEEGFTRIRRNPRSKFESVRHGEFFCYKFDKWSIDNQDINQHITDILYKYQIFDDYDSDRREYKYNCLLYAIYQFVINDVKVHWDQRESLARKICDNLLYENHCRMTSSKDIVKINEWLVKHKYNYYLQLFDKEKDNKIKPINDKKTTSKVTENNLTPIPIIILSTEQFYQLTINHYILYEYIDLNEDEEEWLKSLVTDDNDLGFHNGYIQNHQINSYRLLNFLFHVLKPESNEKKFFIKYYEYEIDEMTKLHNIEMYDTNSTLRLLNTLDESSVEHSHEIYFDKHHRPSEKKFDFKHIVFADFESDTTYKYKSNDEVTTHKPYCISWIDKNEDEVHHLSFECNTDGEIVFNPNQIFEELDDMTLIYFHNSSYDIRMFDYSDPKLKIENVVERGANSYCRNLKYGEGKHKKHFRIVDSFKMIASGLAKFKTMFGFEEEYEKEVFPYNFYTFKSFETLIDNGFVVNMNDVDSKFFKSDSDYEQFKSNIHRLYGSDMFDVRDYARYYCDRDVKVLKQGMLKFQSDINLITGLDIFSFFTLPSLANKAFENNVYSKVPDGHKAYKYNGIIREYIQKSIYGGICTSLEAKKWLILKLLTDFDAVSLYPSAMKRLYYVTGRCKKFNTDQIKYYNQNKHKLIYNTNGENENNPKKYNAYVITIRITSSKPSKMSRIVVKNTLIDKFNQNGQRYKELEYPHLPPGNNYVVVNPNFDLTDEKYKNISLEDDDRYYTVKEATVTINDITFIDYINFYNIKYEILGGIYWLNTKNNPSTKVFTIRNYIEELFQARFRYQQDKNTGMATAIKLLMNSAYGKSIQNAIDTKTSYIKNVRIYTNEGKHNQDINKLYNMMESKWYKQCKTGEITYEEYESKCANFYDTTVYNDLIPDFIGAKQAIIKDIVSISDDLYRFETIENTYEYSSNTLFGSHLLSMSKRIMMEVISTAEENNINVYYQDTDSMHLEASQVTLLGDKFEEKYGRELIGKQLGQFHSDFDTFELEDGTRNKFTVSSMCIINGKKCYLDVLTNGDKAFGHSQDDIQFKSNNIWNGKKVQYHVRAKGVNAKAIYNKVDELNKEFDYNNFTIVDIYMGLLRDLSYKFDISSAISTFKMNNNQHVNTIHMTRNIQFKNPFEHKNNETYLIIE